MRCSIDFGVSQKRLHRSLTVSESAFNGLVNLAHLGLEDYSNEIFVDYSSTLYNFEQVRREMDFIRGKTDKHGNVRIKQFLNALASYCQ